MKKLVTRHYHFVTWGDGETTRPTTAFARGCKLWSAQRQFYEDERRHNMKEFSHSPYLFKQYPEIGRHYPGTWRTVDGQRLDVIVKRLCQPTRASIARADDIRERSEYVRFVVETEKAKDIMFPRVQSAYPRLEGSRGGRGMSAAGLGRGGGATGVNDGSKSGFVGNKPGSGKSTGAYSREGCHKINRKYDKLSWMSSFKP